MKLYTKFNFFKYTYCEFEVKNLDFFKGKSAHYQSKSGSLYFYTEEGVYRYSNHWGRVANCRWKIEGVENYKSQDYYVGFSKWNNFYPLNDSDKVFYISVDYEKKKARIHRLKEGTSKEFLMASEFAHQRLKQIQKLFREHKWASYYEEDIAELRKKIIDSLLISNKSLKQIKETM